MQMHPHHRFALRPLILLATLLLLLPLAAQPATATEPETFPGGNGLLAATDYLNDPQAPYGKTLGIVTFTDRGQDRTVLTPTGSGAFFEAGSWSPDGTMIALDGGTWGVPPDSDFPITHIYTMNADGSGLTDLTPGPLDWEQSASWSPDGSRIYFQSLTADPKGITLWSMKPDGSDRTQVPGFVCKCTGLNTDFSPDGLIVYDDFIHGQNHILTFDPSTGKTTDLTPNANYAEMPKWAPGGHRIVYSRLRESPDGDAYGEDIYRMRANGSKKKLLRYGGHGFLLNPAYSPDARLIAFEASGDINSKAWIMHANGTGARKIGRGMFLDWQALGPPPAP